MLKSMRQTGGKRIRGTLMKAFRTWRGKTKERKEREREEMRAVECLGRIAGVGEVKRKREGERGLNGDEGPRGGRTKVQPFTRTWLKKKHQGTN
jgi:hypothetical protein